VTSEVADPAELAAIAPAADPGFLQRYGGTIDTSHSGRGADRRAFGCSGYSSPCSENPLDLYSTCIRARLAPGFPGKIR